MLFTRRDPLHGPEIDQEWGVAGVARAISGPWWDEILGMSVSDPRS